MFILYTFMLALGTQPPDLSPTDSRNFVDVTVDASRTSSNGLQVVSIRVKVQPGFKIYAPMPVDHDFRASQTKLQITTRDPKTQVSIVWPKTTSNLQFGDTTFSFYDGEVVILILVQRTPGDNHPLEGQIHFHAHTVF